jgi:hypothetical protein
VGGVAHPLMFDADDPLLERLRGIALALPDAAEKVSHGHPAFYTTKVFAYFGGSLTVDGAWERHDRALLVLPDADEHEALVQDERFFVPGYLGVSGWVGLDLEPLGADWAEVEELVESSYRNTAGVRRVRALDAR